VYGAAAGKNRRKSAERIGNIGAKLSWPASSWLLESNCFNLIYNNLRPMTVQEFRDSVLREELPPQLREFRKIT